MRCPSCGTLNPDVANFCGKCRQALRVPPPPSAPGRRRKGITAMVGGSLAVIFLVYNLIATALNVAYITDALREWGVLAANPAAIQSVEMALEVVNGRAAQKTVTFKPTDKIYCVATLNRAPPEQTKVGIVWTVVDADGGRIREQKILDDEIVLTDRHNNVAYFSIVNQSGLPTGRYRADVYLDSVLSRTAEFTVG